MLSVFKMRQQQKDKQAGVSCGFRGAGSAVRFLYPVGRLELNIYNFPQIKELDTVDG